MTGQCLFKVIENIKFTDSVAGVQIVFHKFKE